MGALSGATGRIKTVVLNIAVGIEGVILRRDPSIVLVGAWMGSKFADNSRFLFQYLSDNKENLNLKRVIWVARKPDVVDMLRQMGYEAYLCGTKESRYWHLKSGIQIVCNATNRQGHEADIDIQYSWGAKKVQLWHGVGMKSVGAIANEHKSIGKTGGIWHQLKSIRGLNAIMSEGGWGEAFFLTTSEAKLKTCQAIAACSRESMFISAYPRNCQCLRLLPDEKKVIAEIKNYKGTILYLPTFRRDHSKYVHPLSSAKLRKYLIRNNYLWIEKPHSASTYQFSDGDFSNVLRLSADFDINVLYSECSVLVSDYSSAVFDAVYRYMPVIMYTPDLQEFKSGNIGLTFDIETECKTIICKELQDLMCFLESVFQGAYLSEQNRMNFYGKFRKEFWSDRDSSYDEIWSDIISKINV